MISTVRLGLAMGMGGRFRMLGCQGGILIFTSRKNYVLLSPEIPVVPIIQIEIILNRLEIDGVLCRFKLVE